MEDLPGLLSDVSDLESGLAALDDRVDTVDPSLSGLTSGLDALDGTVSGLETDVGALTTDLSTLQGDVGALGADVGRPSAGCSRPLWSATAGLPLGRQAGHRGLNGQAPCADTDE